MFALLERQPWPHATVGPRLFAQQSLARVREVADFANGRLA